MIGVLSVGVGLTMCLLLGYNLLLCCESADKEGSAVYRFFSSVLPGVFLFTGITIIVMSLLFLWFGVTLDGYQQYIH